MGDQPQQPPAPMPVADNRDLYCLNCGYNLRGLSGDPRRCPECGHLNPMGDIELPAELIRAQFRRMETTPSTCVGAMLLFLIFCPLTCLFVIANVPPLAIFTLVVTLISGLYWVSGVRRFREYCLDQPGWRRALCRYHLYAIGLCVLVIALVLTGSISEEALDPHRPATGVLAGLGIVAVLILVIWYGGHWVYQQLSSEMERLQREVAITLAREHLRRALFRNRHLSDVREP